MKETFTRSGLPNRYSCDATIVLRPSARTQPESASTNELASKLPKYDLRIWRTRFEEVDASSKISLYP